MTRPFPTEYAIGDYVQIVTPEGEAHFAWHRHWGVVLDGFIPAQASTRENSYVFACRACPEGQRAQHHVIVSALQRCSSNGPYLPETLPRGRTSCAFHPEFSSTCGACRAQAEMARGPQTVREHIADALAGRPDAPLDDLSGWIVLWHGSQGIVRYSPMSTARFRQHSVLLESIEGLTEEQPRMSRIMLSVPQLLVLLDATGFTALLPEKEQQVYAEVIRRIHLDPPSMIRETDPNTRTHP